jgi:hypothetical protein
MTKVLFSSDVSCICITTRLTRALSAPMRSHLLTGHWRRRSEIMEYILIKWASAWAAFVVALPCRIGALKLPLHLRCGSSQQENRKMSLAQSVRGLQELLRPILLRSAVSVITRSHPPTTITCR